MQRNLANYALVTLKGMAMGAADVVPGVSGGTIAFISGIYEELIKTIDDLDFGILRKIKTHGFKSTWREYNLSFLFALLLGIGISILSFAKLITYLLENEPIAIWSFFFGLVIASIVYILGQITAWNWKGTIGFILGVALSYYITIAEPVSSPDSYWFLFLSGFIAIIAMILPGVSGSFILLLLGSYHAVIGSINDLTASLFALNWDAVLQSVTKLGIFAIGALIGIKTFSKVLNWMFDHYKNATLILLTGFMVGSLNKIWPWKATVSTYTNSHGEEVALLEKSILPGQFEGDPLVLEAVIAAIAGFLLIFLLEKIANRRKGKI